MLYDFECGQCGKRSQRNYSMKEAPLLGQVIREAPCECSGQLRRVLSTPTIADAQLRASSMYPYVSRAHHPKAIAVPGMQTTAAGHPVIESRQMEREIVARHPGYWRD